MPPPSREVASGHKPSSFSLALPKAKHRGAPKISTSFINTFQPRGLQAPHCSSFLPKQGKSCAAAARIPASPGGIRAPNVIALCPP